MFQCLARKELRVVSRTPFDHAAIGEHNFTCAVRGIEAHNDVTVAGQVLGKGRVSYHFAGSSSSHDYYRVRGPPRRNSRITEARPMNFR